MRTILFFACVFMASVSVAQTETTNALSDNYSSRTFFLYYNTLRMINQNNDKAFDELIKGIEKMKIVWINKKEKNFGPEQYKKLDKSYKAEKFEEVMNTRYESRSFQAYVKEEGGNTKGVVITVDEGENVYVIDIVGKVALDKLTSFYSSLNSSGSGIGNKLNGLMRKQEP